MPSLKNQELLQVAKDKLNRSQAIFFVDYQGLTHKQLEEARNSLRTIGAEVAIIKNTLMNIALKEKNIDVEAQLTGPSAILFSYEDPLATAKVLYAFFKKYNLPKIRFGVFSAKGGLASGKDVRVIEESEIAKLATLPSREVLLSQLVGLLNSPIRSLVYDLNFNVTKLVQLLSEVKKIKA